MEGFYSMGKSVNSLKTRIRKRSEFYTKKMGCPKKWIFSIHDPAAKLVGSRNYHAIVVDEVLMTEIIEGAFKSKRKGAVTLYACPQKDEGWVYLVGMWMHDNRRGARGA